MRWRFALAISISIFLIACGAPRIDMSSEEAAETSIEKVRASLPSGDQRTFDEAIALVARRDLQDALLFADARATSAIRFTLGVVPELDGLTGEEAIAAGTTIRLELIQGKVEFRKEVGEKRREKVARLESRRDSAREAQGALDGFTVSHALFTQDPAPAKPRVNLVVSNGTDLTIARAHFVGRVHRLDQTGILLEGQFDYRVPEGLAPQQTGNWTIEFNRYDRWGKTQVPAGALFTAEVTRLDTVDGRSLFRANRFSESDEDKLRRLQGN